MTICPACAADNDETRLPVARNLFKAGAYMGTDFRTFAVDASFIMPEATINVALGNPGRTGNRFGDFWFVQGIRPLVDLRPLLHLQAGLAAGVYEPNRRLESNPEPGIGLAIGFLTPDRIRAHRFGFRVQGTYLPASQKVHAGITVEAM
jgi:hypothetical protein